MTHTASKASAPGTTPMLFKGMSERFGLKGEKYTLELRLLSKYEREPDSKAARFRYSFIDSAAHRFTWDTDVDKDIKAGDEMRITFTVAGHSRSGAARVKGCRIR